MSDRKPLYSFWGPRYWPTWIGLAVLRLICLLPHRLAMGLGRLLGRLAHRLAGTRRAIVRRNIELCFPDFSTEERDTMARRHFEALGMSLIEMGLARWASDRLHLRIGKVQGFEHVEKPLAEGKGIILLSAHFTTLEISGREMALRLPAFDAVYRKNRSEFITELQRTGREVSAADTIEKRDIKKMVRNLRKGRPVWYAPDQSYSSKGSEVIPFFGVPSMHTTATSTLARLGNAVTIPFFSRRNDDGTYTHQIYPPLENFPSGDLVADTKQYVRVLEEHIRTCPEQYFWLHRKFKNLPEGYPDYYSDLDALK
jgi:KDO2-lipid IV(A) lauroyltransferase